MSNQIDIKIEAKKLTPDKFLEGVKEFFALVQGVSKNVTGKMLDWDVEVEKSSRCVRIKESNPSPDYEIAIETTFRGIRALRSGIVAIPEGFTRAEVRAAQILSELSDGNDVQSILLRNGGPPEDLTHSIADTAKIILARESHDAFGSVEGKIVSLSSRQGFICVVYEELERREITCYLQKPELRKDVIAAFDKELRILAGGLIHYAKEGYPVNITVDTVRVFPPDSDLASLEEIQKIYRLYK